MNFAQILWILSAILVFHDVNIVKCQEEASSSEITEDITTTLPITTTQQELEVDQEDLSKTSSTASDILLPTPTLNSNVVNDLLPSLRKNILLAKKEDSNVVEGNQSP